MKRPLEGIRVLEMTIAVAGPVAGLTLADLGAEVLKVEPPFGRSRKPSEYLITEPDDRPWDKVPKFNELNRGKKSVVLNLARPDGKEAFERLVAVSDLVLINFSSRVLRELGLEYEALKAIKEDIILVAITGFGTSGPYRDRTSYGPGIDAMCGLAFMTGYEGGSAMKAGNHYYDQHAGMLAVLGALAALRHRRETGEGQFVDVSMFQAGIQTTGEAMLAAGLGMDVPPRRGNADFNAAPHGVYRCAGEDEWVAIAVQDDEQWRALSDQMGREDLAKDERFSTVQQRRAHIEEIDAAIAAWTAPQTAYEVQHALQAVGVPAGAVVKPAGMLRDEHLVARQANPFVEDPDMGPAPFPAVSWHYRRLTERPVAPAPRFSDFTEEALTTLAGLSRSEVDALERQQATSTEPLRGHGEE